MRPSSTHKTRQTLLRILSQGWEKRILIASIGIPIVIELRRAALAGDTVFSDYLLLPAGIALLLKKPQAFLITWAIIETTFLALDINQQYREPVRILGALLIAGALLWMTTKWMWPKVSEIKLSWCPQCQQQVQAVRGPFPAGWLGVAIACVALIAVISDWLDTLPLIAFTVWRITRPPQCPHCHKVLSIGRITPGKEGVLLWILLISCIALNIAIYAMNTPWGECRTALQVVQEEGGPDLWTISEADLDRWLEEDPDAWETLGNVQSACWPDDEGTP